MFRSDQKLAIFRDFIDGILILVEHYDDFNYQNDSIQLQLPDCPSGIYLLKVESGQKSDIRRITILK